jgi:integral membrane protein (TIGR01906 family)
MEIFKRILGYLLAASTPVVISVLAILVLLSPVFMELEYRRPGFPEDEYGFSREERLYYGNLTRRYLISSMTLDDLRSLEFAEGGPIYIERELSHLKDVKVVLGGVLRVFFGSLIVFAVSAITAITRDWREGFFDSLKWGGRITAGLLVLILLLTVVSFQALFTNFHRIFFEGDSWLFFYSDTLIRLFPIRFWQDIFLVFGVLTLLGGILLGWVLPSARAKE